MRWAMWSLSTCPPRATASPPAKRWATLFGYLGVKIDEAANSKRGEDIMISTPDSKVKVFVIPTNEELVIARDTKAICG